MYVYFGLLFVFAIIPSFVLLYLLRDRFIFKNLVVSLLILFIIGFVWDQISVRLGIWQFADDKIMVNLLGIPLEEYLFFIFVPLLVIMVYTLIDRVMKK